MLFAENTNTTTWRKLITDEMEEHHDTWDNVVACTLNDALLDASFDAGYGAPKGDPFTLWTVTRVYFPVVYDGSEWCASVARHPDAIPTEHVGSW